ncbi:sulfurtransferase [Mesobacillus zeae]|uniref:Sulfurtransferase n=1 Tax=Mesobacillus zeae TaxID=1917180 RepID=A0A398B5U2_9BACI|nr:sulfurtransferase [Mesobacillus zeae]RID84188.1 sulfurtransferase [Mesobacillus zeae]
MTNLVKPEWLAERLNEQSVRVVDCRFSLADHHAGRIDYLQGHIPGAVHFDMEKDLSGAAEKHGGRHPLPNMESFREKLEKNGIGNDTIVVAYDNGGEAFASRLWWMLKYAGHEKVYVLNGGFSAWCKAGKVTETEIPSYKETSFTPRINQGIAADLYEVKHAVEHRDSILVDSREEKRYLGIEEPIDQKAGHIPGALNMPWAGAFEQGIFKSAEEQAKRFSEYDKNRSIVVYCGSGITATPNFLALKEAGFKNVKLYTGSFSDWISHKDNIISTGKE